MPYSPRVAKSITRSAASSSRSLMSMSFPMGGKLWTGSDGTRLFAGELAAAAQADMLPRNQPRGPPDAARSNEPRVLHLSPRHRRRGRLRCDLFRVRHVP